MWGTASGHHTSSVLIQSSPTNNTYVHWWCSCSNKQVLTGFPIVTTPCSLTMLGWWNWPMMAASCRNLTFSFSEASTLSVFMATSTSPPGECHIPLSTLPKCPEPRWPVGLKQTAVTIWNPSLDTFSILDLLSYNFSKFPLSQLFIDTATVAARLPVYCCLLKETQLLYMSIISDDCLCATGQKSAY